MTPKRTILPIGILTPGNISKLRGKFGFIRKLSNQFFSRAIGNSIALAEIHNAQNDPSELASIEDLEGLSSAEEDLIYEIDASKIKLKKPAPGSRIDMLKNTIEEQVKT